MKCFYGYSTIGRQPKSSQIISSVVTLNNVRILCLVFGERFHGKDTTVSLDILDHSFSDPPLVKQSSAFIGNGLQNLCQIFLLRDLPGIMDGSILLKKMASGPLKFIQLINYPLPSKNLPRKNRCSFFSIFYRWSHYCCPRQRAVGFKCFIQTSYHPRNTNRGITVFCLGCSNVIVG